MFCIRDAMEVCMKRETWKEEEFEDWFIKQKPPKLPDGKCLAVIGLERMGHRMPDILCLDAEGGLVIMEVKNERTPRSTVGQALEYLSRYDDSSSIKKLWGMHRNPKFDSPDKEYKKTFGKTLDGINPKRRVILVAPDFDLHSCTCINFLNEQFKKAKSNISFQLMKASRQDDGFVCDFVKPRKGQSSVDLVGKFGLTTDHWLYYVLESGHPQILWAIGKEEDEKLELTNGRGLREKTRTLEEVDRKALVDFSHSNTMWLCKKEGSKNKARIIGIVNVAEPNTGKIVVFAKQKHGRWGFQKKHLEEFHSEWVIDNSKVVKWRDILRQLS